MTGQALGHQAQGQRGTRDRLQGALLRAGAFKGKRLDGGNKKTGRSLLKKTEETTYLLGKRNDPEERKNTAA